MSTRINKLASLLESVNLEPRLYFVLSSTHSIEPFYTLERLKTDSSWRVSMKGTYVSATCASDRLEETLASFDINLEETENMLHNELLQQAVFADFVYKKVCECLGDKEVVQAIEQNNTFMNNLVDAIFDTLHPKTALKLVKKEDEQ